MGLIGSGLVLCRNSTLSGALTLSKPSFPYCRVTSQFMPVLRPPAQTKSLYNRSSEGSEGQGGTYFLSAATLSTHLPVIDLLKAYYEQLDAAGSHLISENSDE